MAKLLVHIVKSLVTSKGLRIGTRFLGRSFNVVGWAWSGVSSVKIYRTYTKNDPHNKRLAPLEAELGKWGSAISCIGREPFQEGLCSISEGGATNALGYKELLRIGSGKYCSPEQEYNYEYHLNPDDPCATKVIKREDYVPPNPGEALKLIERAIEYIGSTEDVSKIENLQERRECVLEDLVAVRKEIKVPYELGHDYTSVQKKLSVTARKMVGIELDFQGAISVLEYERFKRRLKYGAIAASTALVGVFTTKKPKSA